MTATMHTMPAQVVKRRGMSALNEQLKSGPVWVISNNTPKYVVLFADDFRRMQHEAFVEECLSSDADYQAGRVRKGTADGLMAEILDGIDSEG